MRFQVPQFIEHEPKVIGPLTFKQFTYLGVPAAIGFFLYFLTPFNVFLFATIIMGSLGVVLAFFKVGGRSMPGFLMGATSFFIKPKQYIWRKSTTPVTSETETITQQQDAPPKTKLVIKSAGSIGKLTTRVETKR